MLVIFWASTLFIIFIYVIYGPLLWLMSRIKSNKIIDSAFDSELPEVAVVIAAYNEESVIRQKISNTLEQAYDKGKLNVYIVADGCADKTISIAEEFREVKIFYENNRKGKIAAINRIMPAIKEPITVFTDANVSLNKNAILNIVKHYSNPTVGGVSGEKVVVSRKPNASATEGLYWKYESFLKKVDSDFNTMVGSAGELFSIRTSLFEPQEEDTLLDDFMISMDVLTKRYKVQYEPKARASEFASTSLSDEYQRKTRIAAGGFQSFFRSLHLLNPLRFGWVSFQLSFHRFARWIIAPLLLVSAFIANIFLVNISVFYLLIFALQTIFHSAALLALVLSIKGIKSKYLYIPFYFDFMHFCILIGGFRYFLKLQKVTWEKAERHQEEIHLDMT